jgi:purine-binding chemotaxis protein CheW
MDRIKSCKGDTRMETQKKGEKNAAEMRQLIRFTVGAEEYGLELLRVKEVIRMRQITWLPKAPQCVQGIINLRGDIIPIVDLRTRFGLPSIENTAMTRVIVVEVGGRLVGMVVDSASQVVRVPADQFEPPPSMVGAAAQSFITEVGKLDGKLIITIDVDRVLSNEEMNEILGSLHAAERQPALCSA